MRLAGATGLALLLPTLAGPAAAQLMTRPGLTVTPRWPTDQYLSGQSVLELALDRPLDPANERIAVVIGTLDVSSVLDVEGQSVRFRPAASRLPGGESVVTAYLVTNGQWVEISRSPLKVRSRTGLDRGRILPSIDLGSTGQLDRGGGDAPVERRTWQDITLRIGLETEMTRGKWRLSTAANAVGVSQQEQRLRWSALKEAAPPVDLSDYRMQVARAGTHVALGNLSAGGHRYLLNGFSSRGAAARVELGSRAAIEAALINGTNVVGWSNLLGIGQPAHRIATATLSVELVPARPGGVQVAISGIDGSVLPLDGFNQAAATDAEKSQGLGAQVTLSDARQRVRFSAGLARSSFSNPSDPLLAGDSTLVEVQRSARTARFGELSLQLVPGRRITRSILATLGATLRHERVDPLYRSIGASPAADLESNGLDLTASVGALAVQASAAGTRDNLARLQSILTSRTRSLALAATLPLGALVRLRDRWYFPQLYYTRQRSRQYGDGIPANGEFSASHVPDQVSLNQTASLAWTIRSLTVAYQWNQSLQDNRQQGRELSDFRSTVHGVSLAAAPFPQLSLALDAGIERQTSFETGASQHLERVGASFRLQPTQTTDFSGSLSQTWALDPMATARRRNTEFQVELAQGINLYRKPEGGTQTRLFVRFGQSRAVSYPLDLTVLATREVQWTLNAGGSLRLY